MKLILIILLQIMLVSCAKDLQPNPYTTVIKYMTKGTNELKK